MSASLIPFSFEGTEVRVLDRKGEPWWVMPDVCAVLEHTNSRMAAQRLDDDEKGVSITDTLGGPQEVTIINESGLWSLVLTSRKPAAKRFKKWITSEVIPAIRKTGGYMAAAPEETPEEIMLRALTIAKDTVERQKRELALAQPKAAALDRIAFAEDEFGLMETAKIIQARPRFFTKWCDTNGWTYFRGKTRLAYQDKINAGFVRNKANPYKDANGEEHLGNTVRVTAKGIAKLAQIVPGALIDEEAMPPTVRAHMRRSKEEKEVAPFAKTPEAVS